MKTILLSSSILILLLAALGPVLRGKISPRVQYALWLLVALRLLAPVNPVSSALSAAALLERVETPALERIAQTPVSTRSYDSAYSQIEAEYRQRGADLSAFTAADWANLETQARAMTEEVPLSELAVRWARPVWLAGAAVMGLWFLAVNLRFRRRLKKNAKPVDLGMIGVRCPLPVYVSRELASPCLSGLFRPAIYITPAALESPDRLRHILAHEGTHYRHGDHWWAALRCLCLCLYWFDPLVWWAAALSRRDCELACDEGAIRRLGEGERLAYGKTLVDMIAAGRTPLLQTATTMSGSKRRIRQRVTLIARRPRTVAAAAAALALILALAVGCAFTAPPEEEPRNPEVPEESGLSEQLFTLPEELAKNVEIIPDDGRPSLAKYALKLSEEEKQWGGWLLTVYELDQGGFEECFVDNLDGSGWHCEAKKGELYYATLFPTDVNFPVERQEEYHQTQSALMDWVWSIILDQEGAEGFDCEAYLNQPYFHSGCNYMDVTYWPYKPVNGSTGVAWTLRMVQPVTQGEGGIWGVERIFYGDGESHPVRPNVDSLDPGEYLEDRSADNYYRRLQTAVDNGYEPWALDPIQVLLRFVRETFAHENVTADCFSLGGVTEVTLGSGPEETPGEPVPAYWQGLDETALALGRLAERITETPYPVFTYTPMNGEPVRCPADLDRWNGHNRVMGFPLSFLFQPAEEPAALPRTASLTLESADGAAAIQMWRGRDLLRIYENGETVWYEAPPTDPEGAFQENLFDYWRMWFDEAEAEALTADIVIPDRGQSRGEIAQEWVDANEGTMLRVSPGSKYACTYVKNTAYEESLDWLEPEDLDSFFPANTRGLERFAFQYQTVFVPENDRALHWLMAGNTGEYEGDGAPEGAFSYGRVGYMYLTEEGWRCDGTGTGW